MDQLQTIQFPTILEGLLFILDTVSLLAIIFSIYAAYLLRKEKRARYPEWRLGAATKWAASLLIVTVITLSLAHVAIRFDYRIVTPILVLGWLASALIYFKRIRKNWYDDRIQYSALLWTAFWFLTILVILFLWWLVHNGGLIERKIIDQDALALYVNAFTQLTGIIIAATMIVVTNRYNTILADQTARQHIYQTLERESIKLFRFEIDHPPLVRALWYDDPKPPPKTIDEKLAAYLLKEHTCQILNLFEMACRFRKDGIMEVDVFGSWVIWIWELCSASAFRQEWEGRSYEENIQFNYIEIFRNLINAGIYYATARPADLTLHPHQEKDFTEEERMRSFARYAAYHLTNPIIEGDPEKLVTRWLGNKSQRGDPVQVDLKVEYAKFSDPEHSGV